MNVTVKLPDTLLKEARHMAVDADQSLSAWLAGLIKKEVEAPKTDHSPSSLCPSDELAMDVPDYIKDDLEFPVISRSSKTSRPPVRFK